MSLKGFSPPPKNAGIKQWHEELKATAESYLREQPQRLAECVTQKIKGHVWRGADGIEYVVRTMRLSHLTFTLSMIYDGRLNSQNRPMHRGLTIQQWKRVFENEIIYRMTQE